MAVFNVSFANPGTRKSGGTGERYGILIDQLQIMEAQLSADGKLTAGDSKLLMQKAQELYGNPGLTASQRSNIEVKIEQYKSTASKTAISDREDLTRLNNEAKDDQVKASMLLGNNPAGYLQAQSDIQNARLRQLAEVINTLDNAGDDSSSHALEYNDAVTAYQDTLNALDYVENYQTGQGPNSDFVAYLKTNSQGEIVDVKVGREGSQTGYLETNGLYGGMKIYGKLNRKEGGENLFRLGDTTYKGSDVQIVDPATGSFRSAPLTANISNQYGVQEANYVEMDPNTVRTQQAIRPGGYASGSNGFIYKKNEDGSYTKYVNATADQLQISENDVLPIPKTLEDSIANNVTETQDMADQPTEQPVQLPDTNNTVNTGQGAQQYDQPIGPQPAPSNTPGPSRAPAQPTSSSPDTSKNLFSRTLDSAKGFLGRVFGGQ